MPQRLKSTFLKTFRVEGPQREPGVKKKFQNTLILVFEVIVQPRKHTFEIGISFTFLLIDLTSKANIKIFDIFSNGVHP